MGKAGWTAGERYRRCIEWREKTPPGGELAVPVAPTQSLGAPTIAAPALAHVRLVAALRGALGLARDRQARLARRLGFLDRRREL